MTWGLCPGGGGVQSPFVFYTTSYSAILSYLNLELLLDPEGRSQKATYSSCCSCCCCYQFSKGQKIPKAFLIRSGAQRHSAYTFALTLPTALSLRFFTHFLINE